VVCVMLQRDTPTDGASDPMLLKREVCFSVPPSRAAGSAVDAPPPSVGTTIQVSLLTVQVEPSIGDNVVSASPTSSEERLDCFLDTIQKKPASPLLAVPTRLAVQPSKAPKHSSSKLASSKLAKITIACRGEVLLMRHFDMEAGELDGVFKSGLSGGYANKLLDACPLPKANARMQGRSWAWGQ
jgi:hypothetical protein